MPYLGVKPAAITSATEAEIAGDLTVDTNTLKVDAANNRVFVGASSGDRKFEVHDTGVVVANFKSTGANSLMAFDNSSDTSQNHMIGFSGDDFRVVETTEKIRVLSSGGLTFNGDTAAANALDEYEEGTWTPVLTPASSGSITISSSTAKYTKIGNLVFINVFITIGSVSSPNGRLGLSGSPYSATGQPYAAVCHVNGFSSFSGKAGALVEASGTFNIDRYVNGGLAADLANYAGAGDNIFLTATYPVS